MLDSYRAVQIISSIFTLETIKKHAPSRSVYQKLLIKITRKGLMTLIILKTNFNIANEFLTIA